LTEEEKVAKTAPKHKLEFDYKYFWTPVGTNDTSRQRGVPFSYATQNEAMVAFDEIRELKKDSIASDPDFKMCLVEVKYVPPKVKLLKQDWFDKYAKQEVALEMTKPYSEEIKGA